MNYKKLLKSEKYPKEILDIFDGTVEVPDFTIEAPINPDFGFPPALIPLWSNGSWPGYVGLVKHWFGDKPDIYVQYYSELNSYVEIARDFEQLKAWLVFDFLCNVPAPDEVGRFAESIGFCSAEKVENIFSDCDDISELRRLQIFNRDLPAVIEKGEEYGEPEWVMETISSDEIHNLILSGKLENAWYQLNSSILDNDKTLNLLKEMSSCIEDADKRSSFDGLINCWSEQNK